MMLIDFDNKALAFREFYGLVASIENLSNGGAPNG
jgi:hypothetical protein